jgi:response regulator RpfG family c-di-GMP phosphodiesterase
MGNPILFVDDEQQILTGFRRQFEERFEIHTAASGEEGLNIAKTVNFAVVVSDYQMPEMNGLQFLMKMKELYPNTIRIMLTGQADIEAVINLINEGNIFRFLTKPCPPEHLKRTVMDALEYLSLMNAEKELLSKTLTGSMQIMSDFLGIVRPKAFSQSVRIRNTAKQIAAGTDKIHGWQITIAATLSQLGCITVPQDIMEKVWQNALLSAEEMSIYQHMATASADMVAKIPRLEKVAEIIRYQFKNFDGSGVPEDDKSGTDIPLGSRILRAAIDYEILRSAEKKGRDSVAVMKNRTGIYDTEILEILEAVVRESEKEKAPTMTKLRSDDLAEGMYLAEDLVSATGVILGEKKQMITKTLISAIKNYAVRGEISEPIPVIV